MSEQFPNIYINKQTSVKKSYTIFFNRKNYNIFKFRSIYIIIDGRWLPDIIL